MNRDTAYAITHGQSIHNSKQLAHLKTLNWASGIRYGSSFINDPHYCLLCPGVTAFRRRLLIALKQNNMAAIQ